jgi:integrase
MTAKRSRANGEGSIFPYRNGYAAYAWVTKPDGLRIRKYVYGPTREQVHDKWVKLLKAAQDGPVLTRSMTLGAYAQYWLHEIVEPNLSPTTYLTYEYVIRCYVSPGLGTKRLDRLQRNVREVQSWINTVARTCQCCAQGKDARRPEPKRRCCAVGRCCGDLPSPATIAHIRRVLRTLLARAVTDGEATQNVARLIKVPPARTHKRKAWSSDEARRFLESARVQNDPFYAAYVLVLVLGLRKGELLGLGWDSIDLDNAELTVDWQLQRLSHRLVRRETKTETSDATLPLPVICLTALTQQRANRETARQAAGELWHDSALVFTTRYGTPIEPRNFNRYWDRRCEAAGVRKITVHDARRTCGTLLADLDVHPRVAMAILRHAQFSITMEIYTQVSSQATRDALKRLGESLDQ